MTRRALLAWVGLAPAAALGQAVQAPAALAAQVDVGAVPLSEVPGGAVNGVNAVFTLSYAPLANTQLVFRNGVALFPASGDYLIAGNVLTFQPGAIPQASDHLVVVYWAQP